MINRILRIAKLLDKCDSAYGGDKTDMIEIVIRVPVSERAGLDKNYPKGEIEASSICYTRDDPSAGSVRFYHMAGNVTNTFDLDSYLREWQERLTK